MQMLLMSLCELRQTHRCRWSPVRSPFLSVLRSAWLAQLGDLKTPNYLDHINGWQRLYFVIKVKQLVSIHKDPKSLVLAMDLNPKRLVWDEREVSYGCIFLTPFPRNPCIPQELPFGESCAEFKGHISELFIITLLIVAAGQTDVKAVWLWINDAHYNNFLPRPHSTSDPSTKRNCQNTRDVFFIRGDKPRISKRVIKVKIIFGVLQIRKRRFKKPLNMRNAIKHERCNADADLNNKRQAFYICTSALNTDKNRMCTKHIRDKRGLEVFFVHLCISTQSFQLQE